MPKKVSTTNVNSCQFNENKWDNAITTAEKELDELRRHAYRLRDAIRIFKENKRDGVPWPGKEKQDEATN